MTDRIEQLAHLAADVCIRRNRCETEEQQRRLEADLHNYVGDIASERRRMVGPDRKAGRRE